MPSADGLQVRNLLKRGHIGYKVDDTPVALRIRQVGGAAVTSVTVTTATNIVLIDADGTKTVGFGATGDVQDADTIGKVADGINSFDNWECKILDGLRADASTNTLVTGAIAASSTEGISYYDAVSDTSVLKALTYRLTYDRSVGENAPKALHRVHIRQLRYFADIDAAAVDGVQVWEVDKGVATQVLSMPSVDISATTVNWASGEGYITASEGNDLVVRVANATTLTDHASNFIEVVGSLE